MAGPKLVSHFREHTGDVQDDRRQEQTRQLTEKFNAMPSAQGRLISVRFVAATSKTINHGLGVPAAFRIERHNYDGAGGAPVFREGSQAGLDTKNQLAIVATTNCDVDLWFYPRASKAIDATTGIGV